MVNQILRVNQSTSPVEKNRRFGVMSKEQPQSRRKHVPQSTCIVCRGKEAKRALTRLVGTDAGVLVDPSGKMSGRGAYVCSNPNCWERAVNTNVLEKALRTTLTDEDRKRLQQALQSL